MKLRQHLELDKQTGLVDVQVLDVLSEIESLLRKAREIQRQILRVRGVPRPERLPQRRAAAAAIRKAAREMIEDSMALARVLRELTRASDGLRESTEPPRQANAASGARRSSGPRPTSRSTAPTQRPGETAAPKRKPTGNRQRRRR